MTAITSNFPISKVQEGKQDFSVYFSDGMQIIPYYEFGQYLHDKDYLTLETECTECKKPSPCQF